MLEALLTGLSLGLLLAISIGPIIFAIIKQSLNNGHVGGFLFVAGVSASDIFLVLLCNLLSSLFATALKHQTVIGIFGSVLLLTMGIYTLFFKKVATDNGAELGVKVFSKRQKLGIFISGFFVNILNPGVFVFWLAATTKIHGQAQDSTHPIRYIFTVYITCLLFVLSTDIAKVLLAGKIRPKLTPHNLHNIDRISGIILIAFALFLGYATLNYKVAGH